VREAIFGVCSTTKAARTGGDNWLLLRIHVRPANIQQTPELLIPMGTGDAGDCALLAPCRPAAASAAHHTRRLSNVCAVPWLFLHGPRVAPTTSMRIPLYRPCKKQHLRSPSSVRTRQSEKAAATGDTQQGESNHVLAAIPSSSQSAEPANYYGLCRWLTA